MSTASIESIVSMYASWGSEKYDEEITQLAHALQCAALASRDGARNELIAAALLHDIGHLFEIERKNGPDHHIDLRHERTGSEFLQAFFPKSVTAPIAMHVEAKRYLAANEPGYVEALSHGSQQSLEVQGGPFTASECAEFLGLEASADAINLRRWDDHGKVIDLMVPEFDSWIPLLREVANG
jgi:phosphonate degradation associated HDIG domain protein